MNANDLAFPHTASIPDMNDQKIAIAPGLSKREWLAGMCLQGIVSNDAGMARLSGVLQRSGAFIDLSPQQAREKTQSLISAMCIEHADSLLAALNKPQEVPAPESTT